MGDPQSCYHGCVQNERIALLERHIMEVKHTDRTEKLSKEVGRWFLARVPNISTGVLSDEEVVQHASQDKRKRVAQALSWVRRFGYSCEYAKVRAFIKFEKALYDLLDHPFWKAPRLIQHRAYEYCALLAKFLIPIERLVWEWGQDLRRCGVEGRLFAKRLNTFERARRIVAMNRWSDTVFVLLDHSRFDAHLTLDKLDNIEFPIYRKLCAHPMLRLLLDEQRINRGCTRGGIKYLSVGRKMSGEYNTSLGDSLVNAAMLQYWTKDIEAEVFVDGDDSVVACSRADLQKLDFDFFTHIGMSTKVAYAYALEEVEFCQCRPVEIRTGVWRMVRNPQRVISRAPYTIRKYVGRKPYLDWLLAVGMGEFAQVVGVPVLQSFSLMLWRWAANEGATLRKSQLQEVLMRRDCFDVEIIRRTKPVQPTSECRASFAIAWDIPVQEQLELERYFDNA